MGKITVEHYGQEGRFLFTVFVFEKLSFTSLPSNSKMHFIGLFLAMAIDTFSNVNNEIACKSKKAKLDFTNLLSTLDAKYPRRQFSLRSNLSNPDLIYI
jgi:hypothetical protein